MPGFWRSGIAAAMLSLPAPGQTLNLGTPAEPPPRLELALVEPRRTLEREVRRVEAGATGAASAALRQAALALLVRGEAPDALRDAEGATAALLGFTIARRRAELDAAMAEVRDASALESAAAVLSDPEVSAIRVEATLRRLLADVRPEAGRDAGWIADESARADPGVSLYDLGLAAGLDGKALEALAALEERCRIRGSTRAFGRESRALRADVADALALLDPRRRLVPPARLQGWRDALTGALEAVDEERSRATIGRLGAAGRLALELPGLRTPGETRRVVEALAATDLSAPGVEDRLRDALAAVTWAARTYQPSLEREVVRELRAAYREVGLSARESAPPVIRVAAEILVRGDAMSDPGVLSTLNAHRGRWEEADRLRRLSDLMRDASRSGPEPVVAEPFRGLARALVLIQRDVSTPSTREAGLARRRDLVARAVAVLHVAGEDEWRGHVSGVSAVPGLDRATGGRARALLERLDADRAEWLRGVGDAGAPSPAGAEARLRGLARTIPLVLDAAWLLAGGEGLNAWPGWECGPSAWSWMAGDLEARVALLCAEAARADAVDLTRRLDELEEEHAPALVAGGLARAWASRATAAVDPVEAVLGEMAGPPADERSWMARRRSELARMCLIAEEAAALAATAEGREERGQERLASLRRALRAEARSVRAAGVR
jgi:hypothetical protein